MLELPTATWSPLKGRFYVALSISVSHTSFQLYRQFSVSQIWIFPVNVSHFCFQFVSNGQEVDKCCTLPSAACSSVKFMLPLQVLFCIYFSNFRFQFVLPIQWSRVEVHNKCCPLPSAAHSSVKFMLPPLPILCQMLLTAACWDKYRVNNDLNTNILSIFWYHFIYAKVNLLSSVLPTLIKWKHL